ncbi:uncharacterized protein AKAW2_51112S [Aspergillus luchuensis]|uniref:Oxidoreductase acuF-like C2H2 type zinc-finger domain-containing protein n=1 Tax=Aspergillus kawachii TaxID=1069201 RepID=A0A7R7WD33_ASPKA|nr:uncharacterized protein AKAW2_51112S [Aspergillus luchuensis]BCS00772.1 hypothetical protein AKAW2_51112S [Aspergillus luchuensis]
MAQAISSTVFAIILQLGHWISVVQLGLFHDQVPVSLWEDEIGRLRVWAVDVGADERSSLSLDYRLRDSSHLKDQISNLLEQLQRSCEKLLEIANPGSADGKLPDSDMNEKIQTKLQTESQAESQTELQSIYHSVHNIVDCLFRIAPAIRQPARNHFVLGIKESGELPFEYSERHLVLENYSRADLRIVDRLATAISLRRKMLQYRRECHSNLAIGLDKLEEGESDTPNFVNRDMLQLGELEELKDSNCSRAALLEQEGDEAMVLFPCQIVGERYECPYCFFMVRVDCSEHSWAQHVLDDIMPYVCVFPCCPSPFRLYESRQEWSAHCQLHLKELANGLLGYQPECRPEYPRERRLPEWPIDWPTECPLCTLSTTSDTSWESHVAKHLEKLALLALRWHRRADNAEEIRVAYAYNCDGRAYGNVQGRFQDAPDWVGFEAPEPSTSEKTSSGKDAATESQSWKLLWWVCCRCGESRNADAEASECLSCKHCRCTSCRSVGG